MKRDLELVRKIMFWIEAQPEGHNINWQLSIDGHTDDEVGYHVYLMEQAGLVDAIDVTTNDNRAPCYMPTRLTWTGHEFIDAARDNELWGKAKKHVIGPASTVAFSVLLEWLKQEARAKLGLPPG